MRRGYLATAHRIERYRVVCSRSSAVGGFGCGVAGVTSAVVGFHTPKLYHQVVAGYRAAEQYLVAIVFIKIDSTVFDFIRSRSAFVVRPLTVFSKLYPGLTVQNAAFDFVILARKLFICAGCQYSKNNGKT